MSAPRFPDVVLFVAGEPETTPSVREAGAGVMPRMTGMVFGAGVRTPMDPNSPDRSRYNPDQYQAPPLTDQRPWHLPPQQTICLDLVLEVAGQLQREVLVIDSNRPLDQKTLVDRWVGPNSVLPMLVRPDGWRLEGVENFTKAKVRQFLQSK